MNCPSSCEEVVDLVSVSSLKLTWELRGDPCGQGALLMKPTGRMAVTLSAQGVCVVRVEYDVNYGGQSTQHALVVSQER